jgi:hypothetical protein
VRKRKEGGRKKEEVEGRKERVEMEGSGGGKRWKEEVEGRGGGKVEGRDETRACKMRCER